VDLSAAFDLLRVDTFLKNHKNKIPDYLLWTLCDFLSDRSFYVERGDHKSITKNLNLGCAQGSVLGPIIFNMYMKDLPEHVNADLTITYADDTYIVVAADTWRECNEKAQRCFENHQNYLKSMGMVCNQEKTELLTFLESPDFQIITNGKTIKPVECIKALGVTIDKKLSWTQHIDGINQRIIRILNGLRIIKRKFNHDQMKTLITSQVFGVLYYGSIVWLNPSLSANNIKKLDRIHYAACRLMIGDWRNKLSRSTVNNKSGRMTPRRWMLYSSSSFIIKCERSRMPTSVWEQIENQMYFNRRFNNPKMIDMSLGRIGRKNFCNWTNLALGNVGFDWFGKNLTDDMIRKNLKKTFL